MTTSIDALESYANSHPKHLSNIANGRRVNQFVNSPGHSYVSIRWTNVEYVFQRLLRRITAWKVYVLVNRTRMQAHDIVQQNFDILLRENDDMSKVCE